jgi:MiaB/RimO family radical SAM methylthiotransferase
MKKAYLHATRHPCTENAMNLNLIRRWFEANSLEITKNPEQADIIIVSTCGFSQSQEDYEIDIIKEMGLKKKEGARLIVLGCLPKINKKRLEQVFSGPVVPTESVENIENIISLPQKINNFDNNIISWNEYNIDPRLSRFYRTRQFFESLEDMPFAGRFFKVPRVFLTMPSDKWWCVRCAMGCTGNCSYCGIKHAQGKFKSEPVDKIISQIEKGLKKGYKEIALSGEDLGGYGVDIKCDLADLLNKINSMPDDFKINIRFIDPYWLIRLKDKLVPEFEKGRIRAFCAPAQSGSNRILKLMNRRYTFEDLKETVNYIVRHTPVQLISTNIITGFPGETRAELRESVRLVDEIDFGMYLVFKYEDRPGTKASFMNNKIDKKEMHKRYSIIHRRVIKKHLCSLLGF